jgi:hypothetical protein
LYWPEKLGGDLIVQVNNMAALIREYGVLKIVASNSRSCKYFDKRGTQNVNLCNYHVQLADRAANSSHNREVVMVTLYAPLAKKFPMFPPPVPPPSPAPLSKKLLKCWTFFFLFAPILSSSVGEGR